VENRLAKQKLNLAVVKVTRYYASRISGSIWWNCHCNGVTVRFQGYHMLSNQSAGMGSHMPAVAGFHNSADMPAAGCVYGQSTLNGMDGASSASSQTGDALGKALASVCI